MTVYVMGDMNGDFDPILQYFRIWNLKKMTFSAY